MKVAELSAEERLVVAHCLNAKQPNRIWRATPTTLYNFTITEIRDSLEWVASTPGKTRGDGVKIVRRVLEKLADQ